MRYPYPFIAMLSAGLQLTTPALAAPGDPVYETCPSAEDVGDNVECYPLTFTSKTEIHPDGIPIIGYLFVPKNRAPNEPLPAIVFAHGSGSMYSSGNHNKGLNSKQIQWVRQYTNDRGIVSLHVSSFHSRYLLPDTSGDQRILDWEHPPEGIVGGDDYRATSTTGGQEEGDAYAYLPFDPEQDDFNDHNGRAGVSEIVERAYDMDAAWDFLAGIRKGRFIENSRNDDAGAPTLRQPMAGIGYIGEIVQNGIVIDHERIFLYGTSHGGQTAMTTAHAPRALGDGNPMNADLPAGFDRHRYAAFFDYYGGCGLYGAYNGANFDVTDPADSSTWRPYGAFLMLHGENDPIWQESETGTTREKWFAGECWPRIAAAKNDPDFDTFLEGIIYAGAHHSFDGVARDDFSDQTETLGEEDYDEWIAKIHANERMTLGMIDAIGDIVSARRNDLEVPALADFGFNEHNPYFSTIPLMPALPPRVDYAESTSDTDGEIIRADKSIYGNGAFSYITAGDPAAVFGIECSLHGAVPEITVTAIASQQRCRIEYNLSDVQLNGLPRHFSVEITTPLGVTMVPVVLDDFGSGGAAQERHLQAYSALPNDSLLFTDIDANHRITFDARAITWSWLPALDQRYRTIIAASTMSGGLAVEDGMVAGPGPGTQRTANFLSVSGHGSVARQLGFGLEAIGELAQIDAGIFGGSLLSTAAQPIPPNDFISQYDALPVIDDSTPLPPGEFPENMPPPGGLPDDPVDDPGDDSDDQADPVNDGLDTGNSNPDGSSRGHGGSYSGIILSAEPTDQPRTGGGALFWLLPIALLFRWRR